MSNTKVINCRQSILNEFKEKYGSLFYQQKHIEILEKGMRFPGDIKGMIRTIDKLSKLLHEIDITQKEVDGIKYAESFMKIKD